VLGSEVLTLWREIIDKRLEQLLPKEDGGMPQLKSLYQAMRYACLNPGKRLRPTLCLLCAEAVGGEALAAIEVACAVEMIHCFSLIHDDLPALDNDDLRRGLPSVHKKFGEAVAVLSGDALIGLAFEVLSRAKGKPERVLECLRRLTEAIGVDGLVGGETLDILSEGEVPNREVVQFIHSRKTGALFAASCAAGAAIGGGSAGDVQSLHQYGDELGLAFQITDDLLNQSSSENQLGKSAGSDLAREKMTYPAAFGEDVARDMAMEAVQRAQQYALHVPKMQSELASLALFAVERLS